MKKYIVILLLAFSCSEEDEPKDPFCASSREACQALLKQMDQAKTKQEKDQLYQFYLSEKHFADAHCK